MRPGEVEELRRAVEEMQRVLRNQQMVGFQQQRDLDEAQWELSRMKERCVREKSNADYLRETLCDVRNALQEETSLSETLTALCDRVESVLRNA